MPNPINITSQRVNNSSSTTAVNTFVQADTSTHQSVTIPERDKVFLPVIGGTGQGSQANLI